MVKVVKVVQVVQVVKVFSLDDMHSENIRVTWSKPSDYREELICHAFDIPISVFLRLPLYDTKSFCCQKQGVSALESFGIVGKL